MVFDGPVAAHVVRRFRRLGPSIRLHLWFPHHRPDRLYLAGRFVLFAMTETTKGEEKLRVALSKFRSYCLKANSRLDRMPRKQRNLPVKVRRGELSVHPVSEDPVLRGDSQD